MARPLIVTRELTKTYDTGSVEVHALKGVSFTLQEGEFVAVMGPSGSGKSTFLNLLGCLDHPTTGSYVLDGTDVSTMNDDQLAAVRSRSIGFVFQGYNLLARTSAAHNIELPLVYSGNAAATGRRTRCWRPSVSRRGAVTTRTSFPAASSSVWPSPGPW